MTISIDGFMVCAYISEDIVMHTKYIFLLKQEYIAIPVPVGDNCKGTGYLRIHCPYSEAMFSPSIPSSYQESALKHRPETAVVTPFWRTLLSNYYKWKQHNLTGSGLQKS